MRKIGTFFIKAGQVLSQNSYQALNQLQQTFTKDSLSIVADADSTSGVRSVIAKKQNDNSPHDKLIDQKVLQIDVIQSNYLIKSDENLPARQQATVQQTNEREGETHGESRSMVKLREIEKEKKAILDELKILDQQIAQIKGEKQQDNALKRIDNQQKNQEAAKHAKELVKQLKAQRKEQEDRKRKQAEKSLQLIKKLQEERKLRQAEQFQRAKQQRRKAIEARMQQERKKREQRLQIQKQSNRLIKQLKKEQKLLKERQQLPLEANQLEQKRKVIEKKADVDFRAIEEHQRRYIMMKENEKQVKKERSESVNHSVPKYQRNRWMEQLEEQEGKRREEEMQKEIHRKEQLDKRKKYGELVKNIFIPKMKKQTQQQKQHFGEEKQHKPNTPDGVALPFIPDSEKRVTDSNQMRKFIQQNRPFATAHNPKPPRHVQLQPVAQSKAKVEEAEVDPQRKAKEAEMRRQNRERRERMKKLENRSVEALPVGKPKYENYLGQVKVKVREGASWKRVIEDEKMSKEDKYKEMLRQAAAMESKAKAKESLRKEGDEDSVNLYIGSIQAKLAILQKF